MGGWVIIIRQVMLLSTAMHVYLNHRENFIEINELMLILIRILKGFIFALKIYYNNNWNYIDIARKDIQNGFS